MTQTTITKQASGQAIAKAWAGHKTCADLLSVCDAIRSHFATYYRIPDWAEPNACDSAHEEIRNGICEDMGITEDSNWELWDLVDEEVGVIFGEYFDEVFGEDNW